MAISSTVAQESADKASWDVIATADADTGPFNIAHGFGVAPVVVTLTPVLAVAYTSAWIVSGIDATNIELTKANAVGSGDADIQVRVTAEVPALRER
jgi:hypothetical protein